MTVSTTSTYVRMLGDGVTDTVDTTFPIFSEEDLVVTPIDSDGNPQSAFVLTSDYTVSIASSGIATVTFLAVPSPGDIIDVRSNIDLLQPGSIRPLSRYMPEVHEQAFDRLLRQIQDMERKIRQSLRLPDVTTTDAALDPISDWRGRFVYINDAGEPEPAAAVSSTALTQSIIAVLLNDRTQAEINAGFTPTNYAIPNHIASGGLVYPERYSAVGDGTISGTGTDDTAAINAAFAVAAAIGAKGCVWFSDKIYIVTSTINIPAGVSWKASTESWTAVGGAAWLRGAAIWKKHNSDAVTFGGASITVENISILSNKATYTTGDGWKVGACTTVKLIRCKAFKVGGDSFVLGDNSISAFTNYLVDCYSNNPGGRNYVIASQFFEIDTIQSDGGTIGVEFSTGAQSGSAKNIHCESWTSRYMKISGGKMQFYGYNYGNSNQGASPVTSVEFVNVSGCSNVTFHHIEILETGTVAGSVGIKLSGTNNTNIHVLDGAIRNVELGVDASGGENCKVMNVEFSTCKNAFKQNTDHFVFDHNTVLATTDTKVGVFTAGNNCRYRYNRLDKALHTSGTLINATNKARGNIGWLTFNSGQTGTIPSGTPIAHGLPDTPGSGLVTLTSFNSGAVLANLTTQDATNIGWTWLGGANAQFGWAAALPCHEF